MRPRNLERVEQAVLLPLNQAGLERFALPESRDALNRRTISGMHTRIEPELFFTVPHFSNLPAARAWASGTHPFLFPQAP